MDLVVASGSCSFSEDDGNGHGMADPVIPIQLELEYYPNSVRWLPSTHMSSVTNEGHTLLVAGQFEFKHSILQIFTYDKGNGDCKHNDNDNDNEYDTNNDLTLSGSDWIALESNVADIAFADNQIAIVSQINGKIKFIKLEKNRNRNRNANGKNDKNDNDSNNKNVDDWNMKQLSYLQCSNDYSPNATLTSLAVGQIRGILAASDESGCVHFAPLDYQNARKKSIKCQQLCRSAIYDITFCDSDTIASVNMLGELSLWDTRSNCDKASYLSKVGSIYGSLQSIAVDPIKNHRFIAGSENGYVCLWDLRGTSYMPQMAKKQGGLTREHSATATSVSYENEYSSLLAHGADKVVTSLEFANVDFEHNNNSEQIILTCSNDGTISSWALNQLNQINSNSINNAISMKSRSKTHNQLWDEIYKLGQISYQQATNRFDHNVIFSDNRAVTSMDFNQHLNVVAACSDKPALVVAQL